MSSKLGVVVQTKQVSWQIKIWTSFLWRNTHLTRFITKNVTQFLNFFFFSENLLEYDMKYILGRTERMDDSSQRKRVR